MGMYADIVLLRLKPRVLQHELHDQPRILQAMRMMPHARFDDEDDRSAQLTIADFQKACVLFKGHDLVRVPADMKQRYLFAFGSGSKFN